MISIHLTDWGFTNNIYKYSIILGKFVKRNFSMMFPWTFLEDDSDMLADLVLFYPRASPLSAPPHPPPPPPPGRFDCTVVLNGECETTPDLSSGLTTILLTAGQGRTPNLPLVTVGSALLFSIVCVTIFFTCRYVIKHLTINIESYQSILHYTHRPFTYLSHILRQVRLIIRLNRSPHNATFTNYRVIEVAGVC